MSPRLQLRHAISALVIALVSARRPDAMPTVPDASGPALSPANNVGGVPHSAATAALQAVLAGNAEAVTSAPGLVPPGAPLTPFVESRFYAITNVAMHDALNATATEVGLTQGRQVGVYVAEHALRPIRHE